MRLCFHIYRQKSFFSHDEGHLLTRPLNSQGNTFENISKIDVLANVSEFIVSSKPVCVIVRNPEVNILTWFHFLVSFVMNQLKI